MDKEIRKELWNGRIACVIYLAKEDVSTLESPSPLYVRILLNDLFLPRKEADDDPIFSRAISLSSLSLSTQTSLSRMGYVSNIMDDVTNHFEDCVSSDTRSSEVWFEAGGQPLAWQLPCGVLFDAFDMNVRLPWKITVHFSDFPRDKLIMLSKTQSHEDLFFHSLKQSLFIHYGSSSSIVEMTKAEQTALYGSIMKSNCDRYEDSFEKLVSSDSKHIPIRLVRSNRPIANVALEIHGDDDDVSDNAYTVKRMMDEIASKCEDAGSDLSLSVHGLAIDEHMRAMDIETFHKIFRFPDDFLYIHVRG